MYKTFTTALAGEGGYWLVAIGWGAPPPTVILSASEGTSVDQLKGPSFVRLTGEEGATKWRRGVLRYKAK